MSELLELINVVKENSGQEPIKQISDEMNLQDDIGFSSFELAELTVRIESVFGIDVFEDEIVYTIGEIRNKLKLESNG